MEKMLEEYISNIKRLDWSSFNFEKSPDKKFYLYNCIRLTKLNLSSFDERNVKIFINLF